MKELTNHTFAVNASFDGKNVTLSIYETYKAMFWVCSTLYLCIAIIAITGNGMVLYASHASPNLGRLRSFDNVIKSLAVADMLFGLVGMPSRIICTYYVGRYPISAGM